MFPRIRDLREDHELNQVEVAKVLNVSQRTYSYYETGGINVPAEVILILAKFYQVSADYILGLSNEQKKSC